MDVRIVDYYDGDLLLKATVASENPSEKRPVVLVFHAWEGKNTFAEERAVELARLGYVGCALDLYGNGRLGKNREENGALMTPLFSDRKLLQRRILAYRSLLSSMPEADASNVAAIGYCFGGLCALDLARSGASVKGVVSFHGLLDSFDGAVSPVRTKILVLHGHDDPMVSSAKVSAFEEEMTKSQADWQVHVFSRTKHAFTDPEANDPSFGTVYQPLSDKRSWNYMKDFLAEIFSGEKPL